MSTIDQRKGQNKTRVHLTSACSMLKQQLPLFSLTVIEELTDWRKAGSRFQVPLSRARWQHLPEPYKWLHDIWLTKPTDKMERQNNIEGHCWSFSSSNIAAKLAAQLRTKLQILYLFTKFLTWPYWFCDFWNVKLWHALDNGPFQDDFDLDCQGNCTCDKERN